MAKATKWRMATSLPGISVTRIVEKGFNGYDIAKQLEKKKCGRRPVIRASDRMQAESCTLLGTVVLLICL